MRRLLAILLLFASACLAQSPQERLAATAKLWNYVKYLHPRVTAADVDWDAAFTRAAPKVLAATTDDEFAKVLDEMLGALKDPATHMWTPQQQDPRFLPVTRLQDGITVVSLESGDQNRAMELRNALIPSLRGKGAVVFDLRSSRAAQYVIPQALPLTRYSTGPGHAVRVHSGYQAEVAAGSGGYRSSWEMTDGDAVAAAVIATNAITPIFLVNHETNLPYVALAAQNAGTGAIVTEDSIGDQSQSLLRYVEVTIKLHAWIRVQEWAYGDGTAGITPNLVLHKTGDEALQAAIAMAKSRQWPAPEPRPRLTLPSARFAEKSYADTPYPAPEMRMLAAARIWGVFHYFHPYSHLYGEDWDAVLTEFLPQMAQASDARAYQLAVAEMVSHVHDTHCYVNGRELGQYYGLAAPPVEVRQIEGQPVVTRVFEPSDVHPGDVLVKIDGAPYGPRAADLEKHIAASTPQSMQSRVMAALLRGPVGPVRLTLKNAEGKEYDVELQRTVANIRLVTPYRTGETFRLLTPKIGYVDLERLAGNRVDAMFDAFKDTDAIIMDMRGYPQGTAWSIAPRLTEKQEPVAAVFRRNVVSADGPEGGVIGQLIFEQRIPPTDTPRYKGRTVMLIDDRAVSQSEHSGLFYKTAGGTVFIGSGTTGANGDVTSFTAPGGVYIGFSGHDVRWPDGKQLQRVGLTPDIEVRPTIAGIRAGKDEVLDRALAYLEKGR